MSREQEYRSTNDLLDAALASDKRGEQRDFDSDALEFLRLEGITYDCRFGKGIPAEDQVIPDKPLLIIANHYVRSIWARRSLLTTKESMTECGLILTEVAKDNSRKPRWVSKADLTEKIFGIIPSKPRKAQNAFTRLYDNIPAVKGQEKEIIDEVAKTLLEGLIAGMYPEGEPPSRNLREPLRGFYEIPLQLKRLKVDYRILPVSVFSDRLGHHVVFGRVIDPTQRDIPGVKQAVVEGMIEIARNLPPHLRGDYKNLV